MFDLDQIQAFNDHHDSYDVARSVIKIVRSRRIGFERILVDDDEDKCAIHTPVFEEDTGAGCGAVGIGTHLSIKSLYDGRGFVVCHAEQGVRVIDREFAREVAELSEEFVERALARYPQFVKRYMSGNYANWTSYGRGYCYLQMIHPEARHRVARILGPFPIVSDVLRFAAVVGNWGCEGVFMNRISDELVHVVSQKWSKKANMRSVLKYAILLDERVRIGGTVLSRVKDASLSYADLFESAGFSDGLPRVDGVKEFIRSVPEHRVGRLVEWAAKHEVVLNEDTTALLLIVTSGLAAFNVNGLHNIKSKVRMWQVFGDLICKQFAAMLVLATGGTAEDYSVMVGKGRQCNKFMSTVLVDSDLFPVCSAEGLSRESKAWADILEGVVGILALTQTVSTLGKCLVHFKMIPIGYEIPSIKISPVSIGDFPQLNSGEWRQAAELVLKGKL